MATAAPPTPASRATAPTIAALDAARSLPTVRYAFVEDPNGYKVELLKVLVRRTLLSLA